MKFKHSATNNETPKGMQYLEAVVGLVTNAAQLNKYAECRKTDPSVLDFLYHVMRTANLQATSELSRVSSFTIVLLRFHEKQTISCSTQSSLAILPGCSSLSSKSTSL